MQQWLFNDATANGGLVTLFLLQWAKLSHQGFGATVDEPPRRPKLLSDVTVHGAVLDLVNVSTVFSRLPVTLSPDVGAPPSVAPTPHQGRHHYGDPKDGCRSDEHVVPVGTGYACGPAIQSRVAATAPSMVEEEDVRNVSTVDGHGLPEPQCHLGGSSPMNNGCPTDAAVSRHSKAWPICLAKGVDGAHEIEPYRKGDFHCLLVCPCAGEGSDCGLEAHAQCPRGARCEDRKSVV